MTDEEIAKGSVVEPYVPYEDQQNAINFIVEHKEVMLKAPTGAGKTLVATEAAFAVGANVVLAIIPLNTIKSWRLCVERQSRGERTTRHINRRKAGQQALADVLSGVPGFYTIGREYFRRFGWSKMRKCDFVILDECHVATNKDALMVKMLRSAKAPYKLTMSATPFGNKVQGAWPLARWLWPKDTEHRYRVWLTTFFMTSKNWHAEDPDKAALVVEHERVPGSVWKSLKHAYRMKSVYKADPAIHVVEVDISREQRKHYKELEEEAITWLEEHPLAIDLPIVLNVRLRQILLAVPSIKQDWVRKQDKDTGEWNKVWDDVVYFEDDAKSTKADTVFEILEDLYVEEPVPVVIYTSSRIFATLLAKRLQSKGYRARQFIGGMSPREREWKKDNFGTEFDVIVCVIDTVAEGLDGWQLFCHNEIWCDVSYNRFLNIQAQGRLSRTGQTKRVNRWLIQTVDTVESKQIGKLKSDQDLMDAAIEEREEVDTAS